MIEIVKKRGLIGSYYVVTDGGAVVHFDFDGHDVWRFRQGTAGTDKKANGDD